MIKLKNILKEIDDKMEPLKSHILSLCKKYNIKVKYISNPKDSNADSSTKTIYIATIKTPILYSVALHEIAHCIIEGDPFDFDDEVVAWKWAKKNALGWTTQMQRSMEKDLESHIPSMPVGPQYVYMWDSIMKQIKSV